MNLLQRSNVLPWILAIVGFPIGGYVGHLVAGPTATVPAAALSALIAGLIIGLAQGLGLGLRDRSLATWTGSTGVALGAALAIMTAVTGQVETTAEAVTLGAVSGLAIGAVQAAVLMRERTPNAWLWIPATGLAWAVGWLVTTSIGVATADGWPVYGLSGALVSQLITGIVVWRVVREPAASAA